MPEQKDYLKDVYSVESPEAMEELYDAWADSYDAELESQGYATPARCAAALAEFSENQDAPLLDFGCGTGASGAAFAAAGFTAIDGIDMSGGMLEKARARGVYRDLRETAPGDPLPVPAGFYDHAAAVGVIGAGAAPATVIDTLMEVLKPGGLFVFSFNDHTLEDPGFEGRIAEYVDTGAAEVLFREHGAHIPGIDLGAVVYVLRKR